MTPRKDAAAGRLRIDVLPGRFAVCQVGGPVSVPAEPGELFSVTRTGQETSVVCSEDQVPDDATAVQRGWAALRVAGPLDFGLVGILARLTDALAQARVPVFALSTYLTDYLLVPADRLAEARAALAAAADIRVA